MAWTSVLSRQVIRLKARRGTLSLAIGCVLLVWCAFLVIIEDQPVKWFQRWTSEGRDSESKKENKLSLETLASVTANVNNVTANLQLLTTQNTQSSDSKLILFWSSLGTKIDYWNTWYNYTGNLEVCKKKCEWTKDRTRIKEAALVMFCMYSGDMNPADIPQYRTQEQLWGVFSHESPLSVGKGKQDYDSWNGLFNLTVVGRMDADIPAVHGKILKKDAVDGQVKLMPDLGIAPNMTLKNGRGAAVISNCGGSSLRRELIAEINKYLPIDVYGGCGNNSCAPGKTTSYCFSQLAPHYNFIMSFENSLCRDYVTEKLFRAVLFPWIPVVWSGGNYKKIAPEGSYIDARMFNSTEELGKYLKHLTDTPEEYLKYFEWKKDHVVSAPGTSFICDICDRVHSQKPPQSYDNFYKWWVEDSKCILNAGSLKDAFTSGSSFRNRLLDLANS